MKTFIGNDTLVIDDRVVSLEYTITFLPGGRFSPDETSIDDVWAEWEDTYEEFTPAEYEQHWRALEAAVWAS